MISLEKWYILTPLQKLPKNAGDLGKLIVAKGFKKVAQSPINRQIWSHCLAPKRINSVRERSQLNWIKRFGSGLIRFKNGSFYFCRIRWLYKERMNERTNEWYNFEAKTKNRLRGVPFRVSARRSEMLQNWCLSHENLIWTSWTWKGCMHQKDLFTAKCLINTKR